MEIKINLIPGYRKEEIKKTERLHFIAKEGIVLIFMGMAFYSILISFNYILNLNLGLVSQETEIGNKSREYEKIKEYDEEFSRVNSQISELEKIQEDQLYWSRFFSKIETAILPGINLGGILTKNYSVTISGVADSRDQLVLFRENIEKENCFQNVKLPLSNLVSRDNVDFQISFEIKEECLKNN